MTRVTDFAPPACSSCGGQYVDRRHVDFEAAWDGPVVNALQVVTDGVTAQAIDDLIICEDCLRDAFRLLELDAIPQEQIMSTAREIAELRTMNAGQARYIEQLERTVAERKELGREPRRKKAAA